MKYFRILKKAIGFSIAQTTIFRTSFLIFFTWLLVDTLIKVIFFKAIFFQINTIGGWTFQDCFMLVVLQGLMYDVAWACYITGLQYFVDGFPTGSFDFVLTKPMHPLTYITLTGFSAKSFSGGRIPLIIYAVIAFTYVWHVPNILAAILFFAAGLVALHAIFAIMSSVVFYIIDGSDAFDLVFNILEGNRLPSTVFPYALRFVFTFIIPIFLATTFPVLALKNMVNLNFAFVAVLVATILEVIAYKVWDVAIKHYSSASS